jgi:hypothetical protein
MSRNSLTPECLLFEEQWMCVCLCVFVCVLLCMCVFVCVCLWEPLHTGLVG